MKLLTKKDICLVIPTYNRAKDLDETFSVMIKNDSIPGKIIVVDQSKTNDTKKVVKKYASKLPVKYIFSSVPSSSIAENIGVKEGKKNFSLILISGDDMDYLPRYMENLANTFNENPRAMGVGGIDIKTTQGVPSIKNTLRRILAGFFFLPYWEPNKFRITGPYGCCGSLYINKDIKDAQWIPGANNCFRREVYNDYSFPEIKGYNVLEDIDCSYKVYKKYGIGSLIITPKCKVIHRESPAARYPEKKRIFANQEDHFAFYYRNFYTPLGTFKMIWSVFGIILGNALMFIAKPNKDSFSHFKYIVQAILCCYKNRDSIRKGKMRNFLNSDLTMKKEYI